MVLRERNQRGCRLLKNINKVLILYFLPLNRYKITNLMHVSAAGLRNSHRHVPFHVKLIQSVTTAQENGYYILKLSFLTSSSTPFSDIVKQIKKLQTSFENKDIISVQESNSKNKLELIKFGEKPMLKNIYIRSDGYSNRRNKGVLEAHLNGFKYIIGRTLEFEILFSNIENGFYYPLSSELIVLLHFSLKNPIVINNKKVTMVQFYSNLGNVIDSVDGLQERKFFSEQDELLEERNERKQRELIATSFDNFLKDILEPTSKHFMIEIPDQKLEFKGAPLNSLIKIMPTKTSLVSLSECPPFILKLADVELVSMERVIQGIRNFDMVFVPRNYKQPVVTISSIETVYLDSIKQWLNDMDIVWYTSKNNLNWSNILKQIRSEISEFVKIGSFHSFLNDEDSGQDDEENEEDDNDDETSDISYSENEIDDSDDNFIEDAVSSGEDIEDELADDINEDLEDDEGSFIESD
uniref:FACT complex subunit n=1 Tax=Dermatophagoides pteronyssinus TaxID=6956 RepID=A0A6P6YMU1_DERPT|nr:FACT complex subunit SPT16-like [Dermatophagoides pteronyssinus]